MKSLYMDHSRSVEVSALAEQSEVFGRGLYNDSILAATPDARGKRVLTNLDSLLQFGVTRDFEKHWLVTHAFDVLDSLFNDPVFGSAAMENAMKTGTKSYLSITPFADLRCIGSIWPLVQAKVNPCDLPQKYALAQFNTLLTDFSGVVPVYPVVDIDPHEIQTHFTNLLVAHGMLSMDGDMSDVYYYAPGTGNSFSRKAFCDLFCRLYKNLQLSNVYDAHMRNAQQIVVTGMAGNQVTHNLADPDQFRNIISQPNLFFMYLCLTSKKSTRMLSVTVLDVTTNTFLSGDALFTRAQIK